MPGLGVTAHYRHDRLQANALCPLADGSVLVT
jgi:hypothetical protein